MMSERMRMGVPVALAIGLAACATDPAGPHGSTGTPGVASAEASPNGDARAAISRQDPLTQMSFWAREVEAHPEDVAAHRGFAESLRQGGRHERAAEAASDALRQFRNDAALSRTLGLALLANGQPQEALRPLATAASLDAQDYRTRSSIGVALDQLGRAEQARLAYQEALAIKPDDPATLTNLGVSYLLAGEAAEAEQILRQAAALPNAPAETRQNLAIALGLLGRLEEAEQLARVDLPPTMAQANVAYLRGLFQDPRSWGDLRDTLRN